VIHPFLVNVGLLFSVTQWKCVLTWKEALLSRFIDFWYRMYYLNTDHILWILVVEMTNNMHWLYHSFILYTGSYMFRQ
jgi:hypothetical protein